MLTETGIERRLEALRKMKDLQLGTLLAYERAKREAIPPEVQAELDAIEAEYAPIFGSMNIDIAETENEVKAAVAKHGQTVSVEGLVAQYSKGRVTYDAKRLDGLALAFPQINECKKVGEPFVTLKWARGD